MAHESAKQLLAQAETYEQRMEAVRTAISLGMQLDEIEFYLDWIDSIRPSGPIIPPDDDFAPPSSHSDTDAAPGESANT